MVYSPYALMTLFRNGTQFLPFYHPPVQDVPASTRPRRSELWGVGIWPFRPRPTSRNEPLAPHRTQEYQPSTRSPHQRLLGQTIPLPYVEDTRYPTDIEPFFGDCNVAGPSTFVGSFDSDTDVPAASSLFDARVSNPTPVRLLGKTIPLPEVEDEAFPIGVIRSDANTAETSSSSALGLIVPAPTGQEPNAPNLRGSTSDRQSAPPSSFASCPLPTEILQICDSLPHRFGCSWRNLELGQRWSNQTTLSLLCPLLVHQARRLLLHGKFTLVDVTFGQLYEDLAHPRPILRGPSVIQLEHLKSLSIASSASLAFLFDKRAVKLPKLKHLSLTSRHGRSGTSGAVVLDQTLDIPWGNLENLSLANESSSSCDILPILSNCSRLRQFSWSGDLERFAVSGRLPALKLLHLEELSISSSSEGCSALVNSFSKEILCNITKGYFTSLPSAFSRSNYLVNPKLTHLAVHDPIPLDELVVILHVLAKLEYGKFAVNSLRSSRTEGINTRGRVPCKALRHLQLTTTTSLVPLWNSLLGPNINTISLSTSNHYIDLIADIRPFFSRYSNSAITHTYNTEVHTWNLQPITPSW